MADRVRQERETQYRNESGIPLNRRVVVQAAAGLSAMVAAGEGLLTPANAPVATAQEAEGTRARSWEEADNINTGIKLDGDGWVTLQTEFPFWALGFGWERGEGSWPVIEFGVSADGVSWDDGYRISAHDDGGPAATDGRHYTDLFFCDAQQYVRYRTLDGDGNLVILDRFVATYIDPTDGPWEPDRSTTMMRTSAANTDTSVPPTIITRAQWGANESYRRNNLGEIWPAEYMEVRHAIVHHAAVNYGSDGYNAVRSIYHYHAVTQGWGDIGYNYVVDVNGNIFEGRVGGANVIGGHSYEFANGSSGICVMGDFSYSDAPHVAKVALANIIAYVTRNLNPYGRSQFHTAPSLPTICAHRDVNGSTCPGDGLYDDLPWIRDTVAATLDQHLLDSQMPGGIVPGDWVRVQTENNTALPMRSQPGTSSLVVANIPNGTRMEIERGPLSDGQFNWYLAMYNNRQGWVPADYLVVDPITYNAVDGFTYGQNIRVTASIGLRDNPALSSPAPATASAGTWGFLIGGPFSADSRIWFDIKVENGESGWVPREAISLAPVSNPTPRFPVGSTVATTTYSPLRIRPGIAQTADGGVPAGRSLTVSVAPIAVTGRVWYGVYGGAGIGGGWLEEGQLRLTSGTVSGTAFGIGATARTTSSLNMRQGAGTGYGLVATIPANTHGTIVDGPRMAEGYTWWRLRTVSGLVGWVVQTYMVRTTALPGTRFSVGMSVRTIETAVQRSDARNAGSAMASVPANSFGAIVSGPVEASYQMWWRVRWDNSTGWVSQLSLAAGNKFAAGTSVHSTSRVVFLADINTWSNTRTLAANQFGPVLSGPRWAHGHLWYLVRAGRESGWVPQQYLTRANLFTVGTSVRTTSRVVFLADVNVFSNTRVLAANQYGAVLGGPRFAHNLLWYLVSTAEGSGWIPQEYLVSGNQFATGASVRSTSRVVFLRNITVWSTDSVLPANVHGVVISGPRFFQNLLWYQLRTDHGVGWVPQTYLVSSLKFGVGTSVRSTQRVTFLASVNDWSTAGVLSANVYGAVLAAPVFSGGHLWYHVRTSEGVGWVPQDYLVADTKFAMNTLVRATRQVVHLSAPGDFTGGSVLTSGTIVEVLEGPVYAAGHLWYRGANVTQDGWSPQDYLTRA